MDQECEIARPAGHTSDEGVVGNGSFTLSRFVHNRFLPLKEADRKEETAKVKKHLIEADLLSEFGEIRLERFDKLVLLAHLNKLAKVRSKVRLRPTAWLTGPGFAQVGYFVIFAA